MVENLECPTATEMCNRVSTKYAEMDIPESHCIHFYNHMVHSVIMNASIYQTPLSEAEVLMIGAHLDNEQQILFFLKSITGDS